MKKPTTHTELQLGFWHKHGEARPEQEAATDVSRFSVFRKDHTHPQTTLTKMQNLKKLMAIYLIKMQNLKKRILIFVFVVHMMCIKQ
jgi:hypothetical protein